MPFFDTAKAFHELEKLAHHAPNLAQEHVLSKDRFNKFQVKALGMDLLYATERVDEKIMEQLFQLAREMRVMEKMAMMQNGEKINRIEGFPSENRAVLHTAMRDFFDKSSKAPEAKKASEAAERELHKLARFLEKYDEKFTDLVQIGIGGSDLGPRALYLALKAYQKKGKRVHFFSNVDPDDGVEILQGLDLTKTLVVVVSKSGTTLETLTNEELAKSFFVKAGLKTQDHFVAVTGESSPMDDPKKYLESFYIWDFVGGRYSATSMVGAVTLAFALGMEALLEIMRGASAMDKHALTAPLEQNLPLISALLGIWNRNFLKHPTVAIIPYSQALIRFPAHLQQLDMESNGKHIDKQGRLLDFPTGPVIWGEVGTNGQHSFYQLIHQGTTVVPLEFIGFRKSQYEHDIQVKGSSCQEKLLANLLAQSLALAKGQKNANPNKTFFGNRPNRILLMDQLTPHSLGALLAFYEHKVAFQGFIWDINSFDQEGVQLGKTLALQILDLMQKKLQEQEFPEGYALLCHL